MGVTNMHGTGGDYWIKLHTPENRKGLELTHDKKLTKKSDGMNFEAEYKKSPFEPEVD